MSKDVSKDDIESWPIEKIIPYEKNVKVHNEEDIQKLIVSIKKSGFRGFLRLDKNGVIITGHKRRLAAMRLGYEFLPVVIDDHLNDDEVKAARLTDNRVTGDQYDEVMLQEELAELAETEVDLSSMGFDDRELEFLTTKLDDMNLDALIDDLDAEVTEQAERVEKKVEEVEQSKVSITDALGFKQVTIDQSRTIGKFMSQLEEQTGEQGAEAFCHFAENLI